MKFCVALLLVLSLLAQAAHADTVLNNALPESMYQGYWAMTEPFLGEYIVIDFQKTDDAIISTQYRFECDDTGMFRQLEAVPMKLQPSYLEFLVYGVNDTEPSSRLQLVWELPYEGIVLRQLFNEGQEPMYSTFPEGLQFAYAHTPVLQPLCGVE